MVWRHASSPSTSPHVACGDDEKLLDLEAKHLAMRHHKGMRSPPPACDLLLRQAQMQKWTREPVRWLRGGGDVESSGLLQWLTGSSNPSGNANDVLDQALQLVGTSTDDSQPWTQGVKVPEGVSIRLATLDDLPSLVELESFWHNGLLESDEQTLRTRLEHHPAGQLVAVANDGQLLGAMYSQRVAAYDRLLDTTRAGELALHTPGGPVIQLLAVLQRPEAKNVGDLIRRTMLHLGRLDPTVERACGVTRCRNFDPTSSDTSPKAYRAHVDEGSDPGLLFHTLAGAFVCDIVPDYRPGDKQNLAYGVIISYEFREEGLRAARARAEALCGQASALGNSKALGAASLPRTVAECEAIVIEMVGPLTAETRSVSHWDSSRKQTGFMDLGIDSLDAQKLALNLNGRLGLTLSDTVIFEQPNVNELAEYIHEQLGGSRSSISGSGSGGGGVPQRFRMDQHQQEQEHHVAGSSAQWPGSTATNFAFLPSGGDGVGQIPAQRWNLVASSVTSGRFGAFLASADRFAGAFFGVSPAEASATDPQQRLLLEHGYTALHSTRERRESLRAADIGVFLGIMNADFGALYVENGSVYAATGGTISIAAGRLSFVLGIQGPVTSYDTACSSGLVASHAASAAMRFIECDSSLVLAVSLMLSPQVRSPRGLQCPGPGSCLLHDASR